MAILAPLVLASSLASLLPISIQGLGVNQTLFVHGLAARRHPAPHRKAGLTGTSLAERMASAPVQTSSSSPGTGGKATVGNPNLMA